MGKKVGEIIQTAAMVAVGVVTGGGGFAALTKLGFAKFAGMTAAAFGLGQVARALAPKPSFDLEDQQARSDITTVSPVSSHKVLYGRTVTGGTLVYSNLSTEDDSMLNMVVAVAPHEIRGFKRLLLNGEEATLSHSLGPTVNWGGSEFYKTGASWSQSLIHLRGWQLRIVGAFEGAGTIQIVEVFGDQTVYKTISNTSGLKQIDEVISFDLYNQDPGTSHYITIVKSGSADATVAIYHYSLEVSDKYKDLIAVGLWTGGSTQQWEKGLAAEVAAANYDYLDSAGTDWDIGGTSSNRWGHYMSDTAYIWIRCKYDQDVFGGQPPNVAVEVLGKTDMRDPGQSGATTNTDENLSNPAVCLLDYLMNDQYGCGIDISEIDEDSFTSAKNLCNEQLTFTNHGNGNFVEYVDDRFGHNWGKWEGDELTTSLPVTVGDTVEINVSASHGADGVSLTVTKILDNGRSFLTDFNWDGSELEETDVSFDYTIYRYRLDGVIDTANSRKTNIETMLSTMAAKLTYTGGKFTLIPGEYVSPSGTINEEDIVGPITISTRPPARELFNRVQGIYNSANDEYVAASFEPYENDTALTEDQDVKSSIDMQLALTRNHKHAQMLAEIALDRSRLFKTIEMTVNMSGLKYKIGDTVNINYARASIVNDVYEIIDYTINVDTAPTVSLVLQEISDIYPDGDV